MNWKIFIYREDLQIHYCDPVTLDVIEIMYFKSIEELEAHIQKGK